MRHLVFIFIIILQTVTIADELLDNSHQPWVRWWWHGNAVDSSNIKFLLETYKAAGIAGVEITSIYGVKGREENFIPYLSEKYRDILLFTIQTAHDLDMKVDVPTGSGWRCGGPWLSEENADANVVITKHEISPGEIFSEDFDAAPQAIMAFSETGEKRNLSEFMDSNKQIRWKAEQSKWTVYTVTQKWSGAKVKRAAPGGEGYSFNPYSKQSFDSMIKPFHSFFSSFPKNSIRCQFHDSFEYSGNWTREFFDEFENRRGYDLREFLPELQDHGDKDIISRVKCDYRETISDLVKDNFLKPWSDWAHSLGQKTRNQAHGSPANLLDLYALADIPETEIFRFDHDIRVLKFASSAAHLLGKPLVSAEAFTWQDEHFYTTLDTMKRSADLLFAAGINFLIYHGTAYSPRDAAWPGWLFYASTQINPQNTLWANLPAFNAYVTRCQSMLQNSKPDNKVLVYWPVYDVWSDTSGFDKKLAIHHPQWISENPAGRIAHLLYENGIDYDFVSDALLSLAKVDEDQLKFPGGSYKALIIPKCQYIPLKTVESIKNLYEKNAAILFEKDFSPLASGYNSWQQKQNKLDIMLQEMNLNGEEKAKQNFHIFDENNIFEKLSTLGISGEEFAKFKNVYIIRKKSKNSYFYFLANHSKKPITEWVPFSIVCQSVIMIDPLTGHQGAAKIKTNNNNTEILLHLLPGQSLMLETFNEKQSNCKEWIYYSQIGEKKEMNGSWNIEFLQGGPEIPGSFKMQTLNSWTNCQDRSAEYFAGTAKYSIHFNSPSPEVKYWQLNLGKVCESARILLNGQEKGILFSSPYSIVLDDLSSEGNELEIAVTNSAVNRIRYMDLNKIDWRIFYEINFVNIDYRAFDASHWPNKESGLLGPVILTPLQVLE